jgi:hypothetical protein
VTKGGSLPPIISIDTTLFRPIPSDARSSLDFFMNVPLAIILAAIIIAAAILLRPTSPTAGYQALYGDGYIYVVDLKNKNIANIIPGKTRMP